MTDKSNLTTGGGMVTTLPQFDGGSRPSDSNLLPVGTKLGEFELTGMIGEGGFGIVYSALDTSLQRTVAVKEYMPSTIAGRSGGIGVVVKSPRHADTFDVGLRSFMNEARLLAQFDHPNLVKVYRFWEANGTAYMVMPFYQGQTLRQRLRDLGGPPDQPWLKQVLMPMLDVLELMHSESCYHRDIAPDNIMILPGDRSLLLDFGAARQVIGDRTQALTVMLKPGYAPVEQYAETPDMRQGAWTDIYALAAVWYMAIGGKVPPTSVARLVNDKMLPVTELGRDRFDPQLLNALSHALRIKPEDRYQTIAAFRAALLAGDVERTIAPTSGALAASRTLTQTVRNPAIPATARDGVGSVNTVNSVSGGANAGPKPGAQIAPGSRPSADPATRRNSTRRVIQVFIALALIGGALGWWVTRPPLPIDQATLEPKPPPTKPAVPDVQPPKVEQPKVDATKPDAAKAEPDPPRLPVIEKAPIVLTPNDMISGIHAARDPRWMLSVRTDPTRLKIGRDRLRLSITSDRPGFVYVIALGTDGKQLAMLFPNAVDRNNQIAAGKPIDLPRPGWAIAAGGPAGTNRFVAIVSDAPRDWTQSGLGKQSPFAEFDFKQLQASHGANGASALSGSVQCKPDTPNCGRFGAETFQVEESE